MHYKLLQQQMARTEKAWAVMFWHNHKNVNISAFVENKLRRLDWKIWYRPEKHFSKNLYVISKLRRDNYKYWCWSTIMLNFHWKQANKINYH